MAAATAAFLGSSSEGAGSDLDGSAAFVCSALRALALAMAAATAAFFGSSSEDAGSE